MITLMGLTGFADKVNAQESLPSDDEVNAIAKQMYCPVCENIPLDVCPTQACAQWRELIRQKLSEGWSEQEIKDYFVFQYGDRVLAEPPRRGLNWAVYVLPPLFFLVGVYLVFRIFRNTKKSVVLVPTDPLDEQLSDPYISRIENELKNQEKTNH